jgi:hypothetical protein
MKIGKLLYTSLVMMVVFGLAMVSLNIGPAFASSHREAPLISNDPAADGTDVYAFVSPEMTNTVTLIANYIPLQPPAAGPNFYQFDPTVQYEINLDTQGLARANVTYRFVFRTEYRSRDTFLYNTGQVTSLSDPDLNVRQFYDVIKITRTFDSNGNFVSGSGVTLVSNAPVAPANIGPRSTPNYETNLAMPAITNLTGGGKVFAGPRDDPFFVDLGSAFDLLGLRPLNSAHLLPLADSAGVDGVSGYNVHTLALQLPISSLGSSNGVIGVWSASKRQQTTVVNQFDGTITRSGDWIGVSRLGMPLVNEVVVPLAFKDAWNFSRPDGDGRFGAAVLAPEMPGLMNLLYPPLVDVPTTNRQDLAAVFLTGVTTPDGNFNQLPVVTASEMIRLNTAVQPSASPNRLGVIGGDLAGFPNGRRLADDVVDIELRALACSYGALYTVLGDNIGPCNRQTHDVAPNNALTDGIDANDKAFTSSFPYMAEPFQGYEATPPTPSSDAAVSLGLGAASAGLGLGFLFFYHRRKRTVR